VLAMMMPHHRATMIAGRIGQVLAITFGGYAIGSRQYLLVLVSIFVFAAAQMEMRYSQALARGEIPPVGETLKP
jgi:hypothetical protein